MSDLGLTVRLRADGQGLVGTVRVSEKELERLDKRLDSTGRTAGRTTNRVGALGKSLQGVRGAVSRLTPLIGGLSAALAVRGIQHASDNWKNYRAQLDVVSKSEQQLNVARQQTYDISQRTALALESTVNLYSRLARSTKLPQQKVAELTETIQKSFVVSGATAQEANAAVIQLAQGLAAGALRGDEFRSVIEQAPRLAIALADALHVTQGELRQLAFAGELTTDKIVYALQKQGPVIAAEYEKIPVTIERSLTRLKNAFTKAIGESSEVRQATGSIAAGISEIAKHMPELIKLSTDLLKVLLGYAAIRFVAPLLVSISEGATVAATAFQVLGLKGALQYAQLSAMGKVLPALSRGFAAVGGPIGATIGIVGGLTYAWHRQQRQIEELGRVTPETANVIEAALTSTTQSTSRLIEQTQTAIDKAKSELKEAQAQADQAQARLQAGNRAATLPGSTHTSGLGAGVDAAAARAAQQHVDELTGSLEKLDEQKKRLRQEPLNLAEILGLGQDIVVGIKAKLQEAQNAVDKTVESVAKRTKALQLENVQKEKGVVASINLERARAHAKAITLAEHQALDKVYDSLVKEARASAEIEKRLKAQDEARQKIVEDQKFVTQSYRDALQVIDETASVSLRYQDILDHLTGLVGNEKINQQELARAIDTVTQARDKEVSAIANRLSAGQQVVADLQKEVALAQRSGVDREYAAATWDLERGEVEKYGAQIHRLLEDRAALEASKEASREYQNYWRNGVDSVSRAIGDFVTRSIKSFKDLGSAIRDIARRLISDLIAMFVRNQIVIPLALSLSGNAQAAGAPGGVGGITQILSSGLRGGVSGLVSGAGSVFSALGLDGLGSGLTSTGLQIGQQGIFSGLWGGFTSGLGNIFGGGGFGTLTGIGQALPFVAAAVLGANAINSLTGGGLFGTDWKTNSRAQQFNFGAGGATGNLLLEQSKKKSLFRGTSHRTLTEELDADTQQAIQGFFDSLTQSIQSASEQLGVEIPQLVEGTFKQTLDDQGNVTGSTGTIRGRTYTDETFQQFQQRLTAENIIAVVGQASDQADAIAERWRGSAEKLLEGANFLLAAQQAIQSGNALLEGANALTRITDLVEEQQKAGESLVDTYTRLQASTEQFRNALQIMGQEWTGAGEDLVRQASAIADAAGGLDRASQLWDAYFQTFYSDTERLQAQIRIARQSAAGELGDVGLSLGITQDAFKKAFEAAIADPDLAADAKAQWLEAAGALAKVLDLEGQLTDQRKQFTDSIDDQLASLTLSDFQQQLRDIGIAFHDAMQRGQELGLTTEQLAGVQQVAALRVQKAIQQLQSNIQDLVAQLYGSPLDRQLDQVTTAIDKYEAMLKSSESSAIVARHVLPSLYAQRDDIQKQIEFGQRVDLARALAQNVADLAGIQGTDFQSVADQYGFTLEDLAKDLGIGQDKLSDYLKSLQATNFSLTDLDGVLGDQVTRIVQAIDEAWGLDAGSATQDLTKPVRGDGGAGGKAGSNAGDGGGVVAVAPVQGDVATKPLVVQNDPRTQQTFEGLSAELQDLNVELRNAFGRTGNGTRLHPESTRELETLVRQLIRAVQRAGEGGGRSDRGKPGPGK